MVSQTNRKTVAVAFGGVSPEHEVSVISAHQVLAAMDRDRYNPVPLYVGKDGRWFTGAALLDLDAYKDLAALREKASPVSFAPGAFGRLRLMPQGPGGWFRMKADPITVDILFLAFHGGSGEDGGVQGLCQSMGVAYTGSGVLASAIGMDKVVSKQLCEAAGVPVVEYVSIYEWEWAGSEEQYLDRIESEIGYPAIVKPARLGSSIGIAIASEREALDRIIEEAFRFDSKVVVERAVEKLTEINCSVLGSPSEARVSVLEQPVRGGESELLTFADKYQRSQDGGPKRSLPAKGASEVSAGMASLDRIIPAPLDESRRTEITNLAKRVFQLFECSGVARIDFMIDEELDAVFFNEINTIPGSFSFYLWDPAGVDFSALVSELIEIGLARHRAEATRVRSYDVNLLSEKSLGGLKGSKSS
ncbi:MAG: D-alanine--D-alanine ligase [Rhodothermia bacterium]|nr:D-alanine--D-alanine ligase [Rhodothermia bacterium]